MDTFDFSAALERIRHWLPAQGPIKDFVHHNTLHAFQHLEFHDASRAAARLYGARPYMPGEFYLDAYRSGDVQEAALEEALKAAFPDERARSSARARMVSGPIEAPGFPGVARSGLRALWSEPLNGVSLDRLAHPPLFRLIGGYLDQGLSIWRMPGADRKGFLEAVSALVESSWLPLDPYSSPGATSARDLLKLPAADAATQALHRIVGNAELFEAYLLESLLAQRGWAGLVAQCEGQPSSLLSPRQITLADYAAVTLITDLACLERKLGRDFQAFNGHPIPNPSPTPDAVPVPTQEEMLLAAWQEAFEWSYLRSLLGGIVSVASEATQASSGAAKSWAFFCIDDRECSFRRHIEETDPGIETFATAGFFGLDFMYQGANDKIAAKHCPVPMTPRHMVIEEMEEAPSGAGASRWDRLQHLEAGSNTFFRGWILSYALGLGAMLRLAASVFRPSMAPVLVPPLSTVSEKGRLRLTREDGSESPDGIHFGYTVDELADRVQGVLQSVGAGEKWPKLVVFFGHGSSSVNNPYFAAYNCGACSGRPGSPNARAFSQAANLPEVRKALRGRGIDIPDSTWFVGALHDTSLDQVTYFDLDRVPARSRAELDRFRDSIDRSLAANAAERCRRFETAPERLTAASALTEVRDRAVSLFEPRPEYNHATNASCIVGRRKITEKLFLDRRAFLSSYDPTRDADGKLLAGILAAVVPVCGGINLEYYFSRVDPNVYGAGSKLPQNVTGLIGVLNGIEGDLLTGLPTQMTEIHDPMRLLVVVEQTPRIALSAAQQSPGVLEWVRNGWVRYSCVDPDTAQAFLYQNGEMRKLESLELPRKSWKSSLEASREGRGNLPIGIIGEAKGARPC